MPKPKKQLSPTSKVSLKDFLEAYDQVSLTASLNSLEGSLGYELLKAYGSYVQRQYEVDALDLIPKQDMVQAAAYASGYAKALESIFNDFLPGLRNAVAGKSQVIENQRPEE